MTNAILTHDKTPQVLFSENRTAARRSAPAVRIIRVRWYIRVTLYAFVFSLPFEEAFTAIGATLPKLFGVALAALALLQPKVCFKSPPKAFWCFSTYLFVVILSGLYLILYPPNVPEFVSSFIGTVSKIAQSLLLFWIAYNVMRHDDGVVTGVIWAFSVATLFLAILQLLGVTSGNGSEARMAAFEGNPNSLANVLSLGFLSLFGLSYGREKFDWKGRLLFWFGAGLILVTMVQTGSRGGILALMGTLLIFFLRGKSLATKLKLGSIGLAAIVLLLSVSYQVESVRQRWERTFYEQSFSGRERIYPVAIEMILERPLGGWGPVNHHWELGSRLGILRRDEHNSYLYLLSQVGLVGALPFFAGLWLCWRSAWRSRVSVQGILPVLMCMLLLLICMKGSIQTNKYFWVILAYALASGSYVQRGKQYRQTTPPGGFVDSPRSKLVTVKARRLLKTSSARQVGPGIDH